MRSPAAFSLQFHRVMMPCLHLTTLMVSASLNKTLLLGVNRFHQVRKPQIPLEESCPGTRLGGRSLDQAPAIWCRLHALFQPKDFWSFHCDFDRVKHENTWSCVIICFATCHHVPCAHGILQSYEQCLDVAATSAICQNLIQQYMLMCWPLAMQISATMQSLPVLGH